jgi:cytochrome c oxidase assembly factor CtaG
MAQMSQSSKKKVWIALLLLLGAFLFYWFQVRPITTYRNCTVLASSDARKLLASKASLATDKAQKEFYTALQQKNMYLRKDYESFLAKCLLYYGLPVPAQIDAGTGATEDVR